MKGRQLKKPYRARLGPSLVLDYFASAVDAVVEYTHASAAKELAAEWTTEQQGEQIADQDNGGQEVPTGSQPVTEMAMACWAPAWA